MGGWVVDDPRFWEPEPNVGDRTPAREECQEEEKTKHICIKQLETAADIKESHLHKTKNNSNLGTNMKECLEIQPVQDRRTGSWGPL